MIDKINVFEAGTYDADGTQEPVKLWGLEAYVPVEVGSFVVGAELDDGSMVIVMRTKPTARSQDFKDMADRAHKAMDLRKDMLEKLGAVDALTAWARKEFTGLSKKGQS